MRRLASLWLIFGCTHASSGGWSASEPEPVRPVAVAPDSKTPPDESGRQPWARTDPAYNVWQNGRWVTKSEGQVRVNPRPVWTAKGWVFDDGGWLPARPTYRLEQGSYDCLDGEHTWIPAVWYPEERPREPRHEPPAIFKRERTAPGRLDLSILSRGVLHDLQLVHGSLVWRVGGETWTMRADGNGCIAAVPDGLHDGTTAVKAVFVMVGDRLHAITRRAIVRYAATASGPHDRIAIGPLAEEPVVAVTDGNTIYVHVFGSDAIAALPVAGGDVSVFAKLPPRAASLGIVMASHAGAIYVASYATGDLIAYPTAGGPPRTIARGLPNPRALAVDATGAYVLCQRAKPGGSDREGQLRRIDLATGASRVLVANLFNGGYLQIDGPSIYVPSRSTVADEDRVPDGKLFEVPTDGSRAPRIVIDGMADLGPILADDRAIFVQVVDRYSQTRIVRIERR